MQDEILVEKLNKLGIDRESLKVVILLPVVQVAWADGVVQDEERALIESIAETNGLLPGDGARILRTWLEKAPTAEYVAEGRAVLVELSRRGGAAGLLPTVLDDVVSCCTAVAQAAGGLLGILWTVDPAEEAAIREIAVALIGRADPDRPPSGILG